MYFFYESLALYLPQVVYLVELEKVFCFVHIVIVNSYCTKVFYVWRKRSFLSLSRVPIDYNVDFILFKVHFFLNILIQNFLSGHIKCLLKV